MEFLWLLNKKPYRLCLNSLPALWNDLWELANNLLSRHWRGSAPWSPASKVNSCPYEQCLTVAKRSGHEQTRSNYRSKTEMTENRNTPIIHKQAARFHLLTLQTQHLILLQHNRSRILLKIQLFCSVTLCRWTNCSRSFEIWWCLHLQRQAVQGHFLKSITSKKTWIFSNTDVWTSDFAFTSLFLQFYECRNTKLVAVWTIRLLISNLQHHNPVSATAAPISHVRDAATLRQKEP